jgi:hypothetical protein
LICADEEAALLHEVSPDFRKGKTESHPGKAACLPLEMTLKFYISLLPTFCGPILSHSITLTCSEAN